MGSHRVGHDWSDLAAAAAASGASQATLIVKSPSANAGETQRCGLGPWVGKTPWRRKWQPTPVFLLRESHGQGRLQSIGWQRVGHDWSDLLIIHPLFVWLKKPIKAHITSVRILSNIKEQNFSECRIKSELARAYNKSTVMNKLYDKINVIN